METQEENQEETIVEETQQQIPQEVVDRAKMMGHIPKEQFRGDPEKWVDAEKYVERAENLMPILKSQLGKYENEITSLKTTVESQKKTTEKLLKMSEKTQQVAYDRAKKDLTREQAQAVADGDVTKWQELEDKKDSLPQPEVVAAEPEALNPVYDQWSSKNEWIKNDPDMSLFANSYGSVLQQQNPNMPYADLLTAVENKVKDAFPAKFENPNRSNPSVVDGSTNRQVAEKQSGQTYNDLSADEKAMCNQNVEQGLYKTKEDWVKVYFEEE